MMVLQDAMESKIDLKSWISNFLGKRPFITSSFPCLIKSILLISKIMGIFDSPTLSLRI